MQQLVEWESDRVTLPLLAGVEILRPERMSFYFATSKMNLSVGALCYLKRKKSKNPSGSSTPVTMVDATSLSTTRVKQIRHLAQQISDEFENGGLSPVWMHTRYRRFFRLIDWCDENGHCEVLASRENGRQAFREYVAHLRQRTHQHALTINTATDYQNAARDVLGDFLKDDHVSRGVNVLTKRQELVTPTAVPDERDIGIIYEWCKCLVTGMAQLCVDKAQYPYALKVPSHLGWTNNSLWVFPFICWCKVPSDHKELERYKFVDFEGGRIITADEYFTIHGRRPYDARKTEKSKASAARDEKSTYNGFLTRITEANVDDRHYARILRAMHGMQAFYGMFMLGTGINLSDLIKLEWCDEFIESVEKPVVTRQNFRSIKARAGNIVVSYEIGAQYMPYFRHFMNLRAYVLNGRQCKSLFFSVGTGCNGGVPQPLTEDSIDSFYKTLKKLDPSVSKVLPMQMRAAKQDHMIRNVDPVTAARAMQHSLQTAITKYSNGSETSHQLEFGNYFAHVETLVVKAEDKGIKLEDRALGQCSSSGHPSPLAAVVPVKPDCKGSEGCLFCDKYRVHADERDTRKLVSCRYFLNKAGHLASSPEQYDRIFGVVLGQIEFILDAIRNYDKSLVARVTKEVDVEGELHPYWQIRLDMLMELEAA